MREGTLDRLSLTTAPVELIAADETKVGAASGFFYARNEAHLFYVTNWHVVTGRNPAKPSVTKLTYKVPAKARLLLHAQTEHAGAINLEIKCEHTETINDATGDQPQWLEHPKYGHQVDVVVIKLDRNELESRAIIKTVTDCDLTPSYREAVMDDIFVIGYPWGLHGGDKVLPLYKRGSIASEPEIDQQWLPRFLIDCRTAEAMSGSPVICAHSGVWMPNKKMDGSALIGTVKKFVGVYSGRLYERDAEEGKLPGATDIGQVWKKSVIDQIIEGQVQARKFSELSS